MSYDAFISYSHAADGLLAPRLQAGLQRFAKPWWKRRAIRVFRDETSLSANPHLWSSITEALDEAEWFVLLLSPDAAQSEWVNKEIEHWRTNNDTSRILPVVTDGEFGWDTSDVTGSSVPHALEGVFAEEPRWVDVRFAKDDARLDLKNPEFSNAIADIAAAVRSIPKDELASEEVRQHRITIRTAWAAGTALLVLAVAAVGFGIQSVSNAQLAEANAEAEAEARLEAESNAQIARARELSASAINVLEDDPELSILLALEALAALPEGESESFEASVALRQAMYSQNLIARIPLPGEENAFVGELSPDASVYLWFADESQTLRMLDLETKEEIWVSQPGASEARFSQDGTRFAYGVRDASGVVVEEPGQIVLVDTNSGDVVAHNVFEGCPWAFVGGQSPNSRLWAVAIPTLDDCRTGNEDSFLGRIVLLDAETLDFVKEFEPGPYQAVAWLPDGQGLVASTGAIGLTVLDVDTGAILAQAEAEGMWSHAVSPDGSLVAGPRLGESGVWVYETDSLDLYDVFPVPGLVEGVTFSPDSRFLIAGTDADDVTVFDVERREPIAVMATTGPAWSVDVDTASGGLHVLSEREVSVWDLSGARTGDFDTAYYGSGFVARNSIVANGGRGALTVIGDVPRAVTFSTETGELESSIDVEMVESPAVLPGGGVVVFPSYQGDEVGPVVVWDPDDGSTTPLVGCRAITSEELESGEDPPCIDENEEWFGAASYWLDPSGERLLITSDSGDMLIYDARTLDLLSTHSFDEGNRSVSLFGRSWFAVSSEPYELWWFPRRETTIVDVDTLEELAVLEGGRPALSNDESLLGVQTNDGHINLYDTSTWTLLRRFGAGTAVIRGMEFSPDDSKLMSGGVDRFMRIWDPTRGEELHRIPINNVSDAYWLDESHLVIGANGGTWTVITLALRELLEIAISRLTRGLTSEECAAYRIDPCPTLEEIRAGA